MNITDQNKVIAEFMGWSNKEYQTLSPDESTGFKNTYIRFDSPDSQISLSYFYYDIETELSYNVSYDWLMPVWFKFRDMEFKNLIYRIDHFDLRQKVSCAILNKPISEAHLSLVEAIEWYNNLKK